MPNSAAPASSSQQTPNGFEQRLLARARDAWLSRGDRVVVGFSGGRDSLALAAAMRRVQAALGIEQQLIHVDHQLRPTSGIEASHAADLAAALGLSLRIVPVSAPPRMIHPGVGIEEAARRERYRILFEEASAAGARAVATAHHQDDQAETVLLHLLRGGGLHGAAGMAERTASPIANGTGASGDISHGTAPWLWRPLLREARARIEEYVSRFGLAPIEDPSNEDRSMRRNALRQEVLPLVEERFPGAKSSLARYAMLAAEDDRLLDDLAAEAVVTATGPEGTLVAARLREQPLALRRRMIRQWLARYTGSTAFSADRTDAVLQLARTGAGGTIEIGEGWTVRREGGMLHVANLANGMCRRGE